MKWGAAGLLFAVGLLVVLAFSRPPSPTTITEVSQRGVAIATIACDQGVQASSSGFVIDADTVVTVAHAIYDSRDFAVRDATGTWHDAIVQYMDLENDLAVLKIERLPALPIETRRAEKGDQVQMLAGAASGSIDATVLRRVRLTTEVIGDLTTTARRAGYELDVKIKGGDSGAAIIDTDGRLAGLVFARSTRREASWATSVTEIEPILDQTGVPSWTCDSNVGPELVLESLEEPAGLAPR